MSIEAAASFSLSQSDNPSSCIYEFGVYNGASLRKIKSIWSTSARPLSGVYGFDSFEGCPLEKKDQVSAQIWKEKFLDVREEWNNESSENVAQALKEEIKNEDFPLEFIIGFYEDSLTDELIESHKMGIAALVNLDCDQYTSTLQALDFLFRNHLIAQNTVIRYDDWNCGLIYNNDINFIPRKKLPLSCFEEYKSGQSRAHWEVFQRYNATASRIFHDPPLQARKGAAVFLVTSIDE
tara:strand:+ start:11317 stop:12027 length:711 start_codon:yes stop_codon:yes gene_type:complete